MAKANAAKANGIKIEKASTESSERATYSLVEGEYNGNKTLGITKNGVPLFKRSWGVATWRDLQEIYADPSAHELIRNWIKANEKKPV